VKFFGDVADALKEAFKMVEEGAIEVERTPLGE
jgi:hypothetical protein